MAQVLRKPAEIIQNLYNQRISWSDEAVVSELVSLPALPDELELESLPNGDEALNNLYLYLALTSLVGTRRLKQGVRFLLERASFGDFGETMRGMHHTFEHVFEDDDSELAELCLELGKHHRAGTRLWAMNQLVRLQDTRVIPLLLEALNGSILMCDYVCSFLTSLHAHFLDERKIIQEGVEHFMVQHQRKTQLLQNTLSELKQHYRE